MQIYIILYKYEYIHIYTHMYIYIHTHIYMYVVYIRASITFDEDKIIIMINNSKEINFSGLACT